MAKVKSVFSCQNCGAESPKWMGKCNSCGEWNTLVEEKVVQKKSGKILSLTEEKTVPLNINQITSEETPRIKSSIDELNRVLGGGFVPGSVTLLGGEPGIGKSTLSLQLCMELSNKKVVYVSGEESALQIKMRADRLSGNNENLLIYTDTNLDKVINELNTLESELVIIDSIQTMNNSMIESTPGSISQIRECTAELLRYAKTLNVPIVLIGHITKDGTIAGPKVLEHMVDCVLQFEGDRNHLFRILRSTKNRFGSTNELGIFEMKMNGLQQVQNPSDVLITNRNQELSGVAIAASMEGLRPMLIETQALVSSAVYGTPQRSSTGFNLRRLSMILAVLEKRCGFKLGMKDVFLNMAGGIKVDDPAIDLAVICSILSSSEDIPIDPNYCFSAEIGLSGEIRPVTKLDQRIVEAEKLGFERIFVSRFGMKGISQSNYKIEIVEASKIEEIFSELFS
ncbi:MAG: DNA repair protein RadA [Crocinitomicaceae bacterium]|nr:DNA repair protein RadA [Crocinitomicaceae bacterium]